MIFKGLLKVCKGIFSNNVLTFEDLEVSPAVSLKRLTEDYHSGVSFVPSGETLLVRQNKQVHNCIMLDLEGDIDLEGDMCLG